MRYGVSKEIITPCHKTKIACPRGSFTDDFVSIHDDMFVRVLILDDCKKKLAFFAFDLLFHNTKLNESIEEYAHITYGIKPENVVVSYSHAHTTPACEGYNPGFENAEYEKFLLTRAKSCLDRAMCAMAEGVLEYGAFQADYNISRRGQINGKFDNAPNLHYEHDKDLSLLCVRDKENNLRAILVNYACHPVFYPTGDGLSGEFPARVTQLLDSEYYGATALFFQSAAGDVRPYPTADFDKNGWNGDLGFNGVDAFAKNIKAGICEFIDGGKLKRIEPDFMACAFVIPLEMEPRSKEYFENQREKYRDLRMTPDKNNADFIADGGYETLSDTLDLHCKLLRINGDLFVATTGGEPCFGVKKAVVSALSGKQVIFIGYTDACAYLVDDKMLSEGGYEPLCHMEYRLIGPFKQGLGKKYTDAFKKAFEKVKKADA